MRFFLISDDETSAAMIRTAIMDRGLEFPAANQCRLPGITNLLRTLNLTATSEQRPGLPETAQETSTIVILVMPEDPERGLEAISAICAEHAARLLVVGTLRDSKVVLRALRSGATEYLDREDLATELHHALDRFDQKRTRAFSVGVLSATGGAGCSVIAANLGCELAKKPHTCGVVDLKAEGGDLATLLDLKTAYSLADVSRNVDGLDTTVLRGCLATHASGVQLLSAISEFPGFTTIDPRGVQRTYSLLSRQVNFIVTDLDRCLSHITFSTAQTADLLLVVMRMDFVSLRRTRLMLDFLHNGGIDRGRFLILANQTGQSGEVPLSQASDALQTKIFAQIPHDPRTVIRSVNNGEPVMLSAPSSKFARKIVEIAAHVRQLSVRKSSAT
ncbi:MAG: hypothetical protein RLZZ232_844 [Planctomycetota bacterium]|jgi:Flp pilus assembly CpaE family ATPase